MGILPFDDWFYHLSYRRGEVMRLHRDVLDLESDIIAREAQLKSDFDDLQRMIAMNGILALALQAATLDDTAWSTLAEGISSEQAAAPETLVTDAIQQEIAELLGPAAHKAAQDLALLKVGTGEVHKLIDKAFGNFVKPVIKRAVTSFVSSLVTVETEAAVDGTLASAVGEATILGIEASTIGSVAATGIAIVVGLGLDAIFDAINGAVERDQLDGEIAKLATAVLGLKAFKQRQIDSAPAVAKAIDTQRESAGSFIALLSARDHPDFDTAVDTASAPAHVVIALQRSAVRRFGQFYALRVSMGAAVARNPAVTADAILAAFAVGGTVGVGRAQLLWYWDVLAAVDPLFVAHRPTPDPALFCATVEAKVAGLLAASFRVGWVTPAGDAGASPWSDQLSVLRSERFDLAALGVAAGAQVWVEADLLGGHTVASLVTTRADPASKLSAVFALKGSLVHADIERDDD